jgi:hypothetical protein
MEHYEKQLTLDEVVQQMDEVYAFVKENAGEDLYNKVVKKFKQLSYSYPIVIKMMVFLRVYRSAAFRKYVLFIQGKPRKTDEEYLELQAAYVRILYRKVYPRASQKEIDSMHGDALRTLKIELKEHKDIVEKSKEKFEAREKEYAATRAEALRKLAESGKLAPASGIRVVYED